MLIHNFSIVVVGSVPSLQPFPRQLTIFNGKTIVIKTLATIQITHTLGIITMALIVAKILIGHPNIFIIMEIVNQTTTEASITLRVIELDVKFAICSITLLWNATREITMHTHRLPTLHHYPIRILQCNLTHGFQTLEPHIMPLLTLQH